MYISNKAKEFSAFMFCFVREKFNRKKFLKGVDNTVITVYTVY